MLDRSSEASDPDMLCHQRGTIYSFEDLLPRVAFIRSKKQEYLLCFSLDGAGCLIKRRVVTIGLINTTLAHPREVFSGPLADRATSVIIVHNHPSGILVPSKADISSTQQLVSAGIVLGIPVRDHIIINKTDYYSFRQNTLIWDEEDL
ncbi:MAG TPA: JAB domain-containing protein [Candidatus Saccharimonadales bacterium]|nr:JAB domain-containing protein [Candidatus Saccharimonadales bacterium]